MQLPSKFRPTRPEHFIGPTRAVAQKLFTMARVFTGTGEGNIRVLFWGPAGNGKSSLSSGLAEYLVTGGEHPINDLEQYEAAINFEIQSINGQDCNVDVIREWTRQTHFRPMYSCRRVKIIDEVDAMNPAALNAFRTFTDKLRPGMDLLMTTNQNPDELQPQLTSRAMLIPMPAVPADDISTWLTSRWKVARSIATAIAGECHGNVRAATFDADSHLLLAS